MNPSPSTTNVTLPKDEKSAAAVVESDVAAKQRKVCGCVLLSDVAELADDKWWLVLQMDKEDAMAVADGWRLGEGPLISTAQVLRGDAFAEQPLHDRIIIWAMTCKNELEAERRLLQERLVVMTRACEQLGKIVAEERAKHATETAALVRQNVIAVKAHYKNEARRYCESFRASNEDMARQLAAARLRVSVLETQLHAAHNSHSHQYPFSSLLPSNQGPNLFSQSPFSQSPAVATGTPAAAYSL
jgi:hypothetical protein